MRPRRALRDLISSPPDSGSDTAGVGARAVRSVEPLASEVCQTDSIASAKDLDGRREKIVVTVWE